MFISRWIVQHILPAWWRDRIDLEGSSIRRFLETEAPQIREDAQVLDAGAGETPYRKLFKHTQYWAVDFAKGESAWLYRHLDAICRLETLPFDGDRFDAAICTQVLEHVPEPQIVLNELFRVLKPGGILLLTAPLGFGEHQQPYDYFRYTRFGLTHLLEKIGFAIKQLEPRGGYFQYLPVMLMWFYLYLFPESRRIWLKILLSPVQGLAAFFFLFALPPVLASMDTLDKEKSITLGFAVVAQKPVEGGDSVKFADEPSRQECNN